MKHPSRHRRQHKPALRLLAEIATVLAFSLVLAVTSCRQPEGVDSAEGSSVTRLATPEDVLSEELMLPMRQAQNFHHIANVYLQNGKVAEAADAVRHILSLKFPPRAPEGEDVILDARARLAKIMVTLGKVDEAMTILETGIASTRRESFFLSNVFTVKGEVHEAAAAQLDETDKPAATKHREDAIRARMRSISIDETLMKKLQEIQK